MDELEQTSDPESAPLPGPSPAFILPDFVYVFVKERVYDYRFPDSELVVRDGLLMRNVRHILYERIHKVALARNPIHRLVGVTPARSETAAGGKPEASLRMLSMVAADDLRRYTLGGEGKTAETDSTTAAPADMPLLQVPVRELARLGLISNRGFIVVASVPSASFQSQRWDDDWIQDQDRLASYVSARAKAPGWVGWLTESGTLAFGVLLTVVLIMLFVVLLRLFSIAWFVVRYHGFTLRRKYEDLRAEYGLLTHLSSLIQIQRVRLVTVRAGFLHRVLGRVSIDLETARTSEAGSDLSSQLAATGVAITRRWLTPIIEADRCPSGWKDREAGRDRRHAGYAERPRHLLPQRVAGSSDQRGAFRQHADGMMLRSPFDRRRRMASVAVDTAGAGKIGHRIQIPFLDVQVVEAILLRLYEETCSTGFRWQTGILSRSGGCPR